ESLRPLFPSVCQALTTLAHRRPSFAQPKTYGRLSAIAWRDGSCHALTRPAPAGLAHGPVFVPVPVSTCKDSYQRPDGLTPRRLERLASFVAVPAAAEVVDAFAGADRTQGIG